MIIIRLLRPQQWVKNLFLFLPVFFSGKLGDASLLFSCIIAFLSYCFMASAIYCFNDIWDAKADRLHPIKCKRPIASGDISVRQAYCLMIACVIVSLIFSNTFGGGSKCCLFAILGCYFLMNIAYCTYLKRVPLIDVFVIALGFVLRILMGGVAACVALSHWIVLMTFLLALFLAFAKRRDDVVIYEDTGIVVRKNVDRYNLPFMNQVISILVSVTIICYIMYTVSDEVMVRVHSSYLYITSVFVLLGLLRYLQITVVDVKSGSPTKVLLKDHFIQLCVLLWGLFFGIILYL